MARLERIIFVNFKRYTWSINPGNKAILDSHAGSIKAFCTPSLSLLAVAGSTPAGIEVSYVDEDFEAIDFDGGYDVAALSAMTQQAPRAYEVAAEFRRRGVHVVMGGIHASVLPNESLQHVDTVFVGEAEDTWPEFLNDYRKGRPRRLYAATAAVDMSRSPVPRYDLLKGKDYFRDASRFYNLVPVQATRGCPHDCEFCLVSKMYGKKIRKKATGQVAREIRAIKESVPNKLLIFADDNLFVDRAYARQLMKALRELNVRWWAQTDIAFGDDEELVAMAYEGGCLITVIGFESLNADNLSRMNESSWKRRQLDKYRRNIERIQRRGIQIFGSFIFGLDSDTPEVFRNVAEFMDETHITGQLTIATPIPGTRMEARLREEGRLLPEYGQWERCTFFDVLFEPRSMSKEELEQGFVWAYERVFSEDSLARRAGYLKGVYKKLPSPSRGASSGRAGAAAEALPRTGGSGGDPI